MRLRSEDRPCFGAAGHWTRMTERRHPQATKASRTGPAARQRFGHGWTRMAADEGDEAGRKDKALTDKALGKATVWTRMGGRAGITPDDGAMRSRGRAISQWTWSTGPRSYGSLFGIRLVLPKRASEGPPCALCARSGAARRNRLRWCLSADDTDLRRLLGRQTSTSRQRGWTRMTDLAQRDT